MRILDGIKCQKQNVNYERRAPEKNRIVSRLLTNSGRFHLYIGNKNESLMSENRAEMSEFAELNCLKQGLQPPPPPPPNSPAPTPHLWFLIIVFILR